MGSLLLMVTNTWGSLGGRGEDQSGFSLQVSGRPRYCPSATEAQPGGRAALVRVNVTRGNVRDGSLNGRRDAIGGTLRQTAQETEAPSPFRSRWSSRSPSS